MASSEQAKTFTVPVGTRLSHGLELELLVAYLYKSDVLPSELDNSSLPPILRVDGGESGNMGDVSNDGVDGSSDDYLWIGASNVRDHIVATLHDHGVRVHADSELYFDDDGHSPHLHGVDSWDIDLDPTVAPGIQESALPKEYKWLNVELRSPAFWDVQHAYDETTFVVNLLKSKYCVRVNASCGFHVHVANGTRYFDTTTLKRAGAFLWAADPMLSRLHAPWRRVHEYSTSIRYRSRLARGDRVRPEEIQASIDVCAERLDERSNGTVTMDPLPVLPYSSTAMEEAALGGREKWEEYARERVQQGPLMEVPEQPPSRAERELPTSDSEPFSFLFASSPSSDCESDNPGNLGGEYDRNLQALLDTKELRARCYKEYGHHNVRALSIRRQYMLLLDSVCEMMFGHADINELSDDGYEALISQCESFTQVTRSSYTWDEDLNRFGLNRGAIGKKLRAPPAQNYNPDIAPSLAAVRLQELVEEQDRGEIPDDEVPDYSDDDDDEDISGGVDDLEKFLYNRLEQLMQQPTFPLHTVDDLVAEMKRLKEFAGMLSRPSSVASTPPPASAAEMTDSGGEFSPSASDALDEALGVHGSTPSGLRDDSNKPGSSTTSDNYDPSKDPAFSDFASSNSSSEMILSPLSSSSPAPDTDKLQPHDINRIPTRYIDTISEAAYLSDQHWQRISWLPDPSLSGRPDPLEHHARHSQVCAGPSCTEHVITSTRAGIATLLRAESAAALAALLISPTDPDDIGDRLNYNFVAYAPYTLGSLAAAAEKRTIEFREGGGSLDAEWIATWARICVGILRFCRDSDPGEFDRVLERVVAQEERSRGGGGVRYDVCDLLEDLCLFGEAEVVRRRERELGPPR
ncbi:hypothetical protein F5B22DRAFT_417492 [Xylaria bambusicola]|uniref:uncharacterized protein n=1 Tax=Xylaria bambusicola TaxID=326684 RepID=UPI002007F326|nr:uncharacterized protein F5B22DRAFT_417492 [Xylaria bambusicola]KAI0523792.1 hypothetical protein F5B22DRAFT_417492 [Xylaria bambusicola]